MAATELKKGARLLAVPVGGKGLSDEGKATIQGLVSYPPTDNGVDVDSFATLTDISSVDKIIADMCPEDPCGSGAAYQISGKMMIQKSRRVIATS